VVNVNFPQRRTGHAMAAIGTRLYVVGGMDSASASRNDVWSFETTTSTWTRLKADDNAGSGVVNVNFPRRRYGHTLDTIGTKLYVVGGLDNAPAARNDVWSFDTLNDTWALLKADNNAGSGSVDVNYPRKRFAHASAVVGTKLYLVGGQDDTGNSRNDVWSYETANNTWALAKIDDNAGSGSVDVNFPKKRYDHSCVSIGTTLYLFGGGYNS
jgi:N-acetylneuraminic acid mutarotase